MPGVRGHAGGAGVEIVAGTTRAAAGDVQSPLGRQQGAEPAGVSARLAAGVLLGAAAYLYVSLFAGGDIPFLLGGDQVYFWVYAQRMLHGERPYLDFFQFTPPGADVFYFSLFRVFGPRIWVTNLAVLALGVALCWACLRISGALMRRGLAVLATATFLVVIYGKLLNGTHHWFSVLLGLLAVSIAMRGRGAGRLAIAGALLGFASFFTQTCGVTALGAFVAWLLWEQWLERAGRRDTAGKMAALVLGFCGTLGAVYAHWIASAGVERLWFFQVTYVHRYMLRWYGGLIPGTLTLRGLSAMAPTIFIYALLPVIYPVGLILARRRARGDESDADGSAQSGVRLVALAGLAWLGEVAVSPTWLRVYTVAMPGIILLFWVIGRSGKWRLRLGAMACAGLALLAAHQAWGRRRTAFTIADLPAGRAAMAPDRAEELQWLASRTRPGQYIFEVRGIEAYFPLQLRNPAFMDDIEEPDYVEQGLRQIDARKPGFVLWPATLNQSGLDPLWTAHLPEVRGYLRERYRRVDVLRDGDEIWERK